MRVIKCTVIGGKGATMDCLVDDDDYDDLSQFQWSCIQGGKSFYARRQITRAEPFHGASVRSNGYFYANYWMHREVLGLGPKTPHVDHIDGDGLNNTKTNLRPCTPTQNAANRGPRKGNGGFKGVAAVSRAKAPGKAWTASIKTGGKKLHLGSFDTPEEAARAYDTAAILEWGGYARLNFPTENKGKIWGGGA